MNEASDVKKPAQRPSAGIVADLARRYFGGRRGFVLWSTAVLAAAAFFNWSWLVAAGIAPLLVAAAPCAAMCALGLCMSKMGGKSCSSAPKPDAPVNALDKDTS